jgi:hypothetical protein
MLQGKNNTWRGMCGRGFDSWYLYPWSQYSHFFDK